MRLALWIFTIAQLGLAVVPGKSVIGPIEWDDVKCSVSSQGLLKLNWGFFNALEVKIPNFRSLQENKELTIKISNPETGTVKYQDSKFWVVDPNRQSESVCRVNLSEITTAPLAFKVSIDCKNLVPADRIDGGANDVSAEITPEKIVCE